MNMLALIHIVVSHLYTTLKNGTVPLLMNDLYICDDNQFDHKVL